MKILFLLICITSTFFAGAQNVGIGTTSPHASAKLDITSSNQGMLVPRMFTMQRITIPSPATGLLVFDTDTNSFWFYNGSSWNNLSASAAWQLTGNTGTDTAVNSIGTNDNIPLKFKINNARAGLIGTNGNIFWGTGSGGTFAGASKNIAIGTGALNKNTSSESLAIGDSALSKNVAGVNIAIGAHALQKNVDGDFNTAVGNNNLFYQTSGTHNTAVGYTVLPYHLRGLGNTAIGTNAMFYDTTGNENTALGLQSLAYNLNGNNNTAIGSQSLIVNTTGNNNLAAGYRADVLVNNLQNASAIGSRARVDCSNCMVLGSVNGANGASTGINVGIGITNPLARLHVSDSSVLFSAANAILGTPGNPPISGPGRRMMWYADKAAFRTGYVNGTQWDIDNIGDYSFASGFYTTASGPRSSAMGASSTASGNNSTAMGYNTTASGFAATALGQGTTASGTSSTAMGGSTLATGNYSTAMGSNSIATGNRSTAMGEQTSAGGDYSTTMGYAANAAANYSMAFGESVTANSLNSTSIGRFNDPILASANNTWVPTEPLLIVGNGTSAAAKSNAMVILKNGNVGIGNQSPAEKLVVTGNVKANDFVFSTPKTFYYALSGIDFDPMVSSDTSYKSAGSGDIYLSSTNTFRKVAAPVHLPHGAILQSMKAYIVDGSSADNLLVLLNRKNQLDNFSADNLGFVVSTGSTFVSTAYPVSLNSSVVDNNLYTYYLTVGVYNGANPWISMYLRSVIFEYTMPSAQ